MYASTKSVSSAKNDRLKPWIDFDERTRSMGSNAGIDAMPFAIRSQWTGLNVDETVGRFVWKPKITRRPVCACVEINQ